MARTLELPSWSYLYLLPITIIILLFAASYCLVEIILHYADNALFASQVGFIALTLSPVLGWLILRRIKLANYQDFKLLFPIKNTKAKKRRRYRVLLDGESAVFFTTAGCAGANIGINILFNLGRGGTFQLQPIEIYLFYASVSVGEEIAFRILIVSVIVGLLTLIPFVKQNEWIAILIASFVSGYFFSMAHAIDPLQFITTGMVVPGVYADDPRMLWSTGVSGFVMALFFGFTKNPLVCIVAHAGNNLIAASFVFTTSILVML